MPAPSEPLQQEPDNAPRVMLRPEPLTREDFTPYGDVIETDGAEHFQINQGTTTRFHDLARIDVDREGGRPLVSIFRGLPRVLPLPIEIMERHPLGSQAFIPVSDRPFIVVVGGNGPRPAASDLRAFITRPGQGVNYARGVWHHPLIALGEESDFLIVDRGGPGENLEEIDLASSGVLLVDPDRR